VYRRLTLLTAAFAATLLTGCAARAQTVVDEKWWTDVSVFGYDCERSAVPHQAEVIFRNGDGSIRFRGETDAEGRLRAPIDFRALTTSVQIEARMGPRGGQQGVFVTAEPQRGQYQLFFAPIVIVD